VVHPQPLDNRPQAGELTRDVVADRVGISSGRTFARAEKIWDKAQEGNPLAKELVAKLDAEDETITVAYKRLLLSEKGSDLVQSLEASGKLDISTAYEISTISDKQRQKTLSQKMKEAKLIKEIIAEENRAVMLTGKPNPLLTVGEGKREHWTDNTVGQQTHIGRASTFARAEKIWDKAQSGR
jgi:hypothetical protein